MPLVESQTRGFLIPNDVLHRLKPGDKVLNIQDARIPKPIRPVSKTEAMMGLTQAKTVAEIGQAPPFASIPTPELMTSPEHNLFVCLFGRDPLITSLKMRHEYPQMLRSTVIALAELQALTRNFTSGAEPGKIIHEHRKSDDPQGKKLIQEGMVFPNYGSVDATLWWSQAVAALCRSSDGTSRFDVLDTEFEGLDGRKRTLGDAYYMGINWQRINSNNPWGVIPFRKTSVAVADIQFWKDSPDSVHDESGDIPVVTKNIVAFSPQVLAYDSAIDAAELLLKLKRPLSRYQRESNRELAGELMMRAEKIAGVLKSHFWVEDEKGGYFVIAWAFDNQGTFKPMRIRASDMGHALHSRLLGENTLENRYLRNELTKQLSDKDMLAEGGIKTVSRTSPRHHPGGYHNGQVWPWDNGYIADGAEMQGEYGFADELKSRSSEAIRKSGVIPENFRGDSSAAPNTQIIDIYEAQQGWQIRLVQAPQPVQAFSAAYYDERVKDGQSEAAA